MQTEFLLQITFEELEILRQCVRIAIADGSILGGTDPDVQAVSRRTCLIYRLAGRLDDIHRPGPRRRLQS